MARIIDEGKIQRIREATIALVVQNGYGGAAISSIARRAGVAEGYLYRFYTSKQALVTELLYTKVARIIEKLEFLLNSCLSIKDVIKELINELFKMASESAEEIKFIHVLMHDYNFQVSQVQRQHIKSLCERVIRIGVQNGYGGAAISSIARRAGVAEGYLYRFYTSKHALVTELLYTKVARIIEKLEFLLNSCLSIEDVIKELINELFKMASESAEEIKFIHVLMHDYNFQVSLLQRQHIKSLCERVIRIGVQNGEVSPYISAEEAYGIVVIYPIEFINLRMKGFFGNTTWTVEDQKRVAEFSINALK